jgi:hypothetical protein
MSKRLEEVRDKAIKALESQRNLTNEELYQSFINLEAENERLHDALESSISIPSGATNGDVIKAVFPRIKHSFTDKDSKVYILEPNDILTPILTAFDSWWNAPYREGDAE